MIPLIRRLGFASSVWTGLRKATARKGGVNKMSSEDARHELFISHRMEDLEIARAIRDGLQDVAGKKAICVHVCTQNQGTQNWKKDIEDAISTSTTLVFLYTVEQEETWRWCMYEIGLFKGLMLKDDERMLICIKNSDLEMLPSPIRDTTEPYTADAKGHGVKSFCEDLLFNKKFTSHQLADQASSDVRDNLKAAVKIINKNFERSRLETEYYGRRITIKLTDGNNRVLSKVEDAIIEGTEDTMPALFAKEDGINWQELEKELTKTNQTRWLEQLRQNIEKIQFKQDFEKDLTPIRINRNSLTFSYIPIISSVVKNRITARQDSRTGKTQWYEVTELNVIFIKQTIDRENLLKAVPSLIPFCKIKMFLDFDPKKNEKTMQLNDQGQPRWPLAVEMNNLCLQLFDISEVEFNSSKDRWTTPELIERLDTLGFVETENLKKLGDDQNRVIQEIVFQGRSRSEAYVPIAFNENHLPEFRNQCFLPCITNIQTEGDTSGKHEATLLVAYVKDFWPPDDARNPINKSSQNDT